MKNRKKDMAHRREQAVDWALRAQDRGLSEEESRALRDWISSDPANAEALQNVRDMMGDARRAMIGDPDLSTYEARPFSNAPRNFVVTGLLAAAALFVAFDGPMRLQADAIADAGELPLFTLADGSLLQLNAGSAVAFDMDGSARTVRLLRGEAFFQVAKDPSRPFAVEASDGRVVALGTAFNVRLADKGLDVTVTEHAVEVTVSDKIGGVRVGEGEALVVLDGHIGPVVPASENKLAWRKGLLVADNMPLEDVVKEIERHYAGRIFIASRDLAERRVSGSFSVTEPEAALRVLEQTLQLRVTRIGPIAVVRT